jgi:tRNA A-37 threonylcarbamoyl transferase component Bud32
MIEVGQTVGNYRVLQKIGEGGMGAVYLAEHPVIGRKAALKVIHPQHSRNADVVARFVNEASAISRVGHEHIVEVTDFGRTDGGDFYFIMEYLEGRSLAEVIAAQAPFPPERALAVATQIADALAASHAHGVIHRDLKPENIFLVPRGEEPDFVKVLDFGLAKLVHDDGTAPHETRAGIVMGTPYYMSPEQCEGAREIDGRADVYALGVVLFEMLTGKLPFGGGSEGEVLMKQMTMLAPAVRSLVPDLPPTLDAIVRRALAKKPAERYPTMASLGEALLAPEGHVPPIELPADADASGVMRAARPMSRAEIKLHRVQQPVLGRLHPARRRRMGRAVSSIGLAAFTSLALSAGGTLWWINRRTAASAPAAELTPRTIALSFSSDPDGATVVGPDGAVLGTTPLSIQIARLETPVAYVFEKAGFERKTMSLIPNVPSSVFAAMQALEPPPADDPPTTAARSPPVTSERERRGRTARHPRDEDDVLAPSFLK